MEEAKLKKSGILNKDISEVIAGMGHMEYITICDAGLPIPESVRRIDLAVTEDLPGFIDVVRAVSFELIIEKVILAKEIIKRSPKIDREIKLLFTNIKIEYIPHEDFKKYSVHSRAIIRTGECTPYANVILVSGVSF